MISIAYSMVQIATRVSTSQGESKSPMQSTAKTRLCKFIHYIQILLAIKLWIFHLKSLVF